MNNKINRANFQERLALADGYSYSSLLKIRVMRLVVFTAFTGLMLAPGSINPVLAFIALVCIAMGGGAAGALNMWYDADIDAIMKRTQSRSIPSGYITKQQALAFGLFLSIISVLIMGVFINWFSAIFLAFTIFFYVVIYTMWLKRRTPQNIVIGGASGAFPPMIGWAAVSGNITIESISLFLIIFFWTPPHFWALSLFTANDYQAAKIPMLPNVAGVKATQNQCLFYAILTVISGLLPIFIGFAGIVYAVISCILGALFFWRAFSLWRAREEKSIIYHARKLFFLSLVYLSVIFCVLLLETLICRYGIINFCAIGTIL